MNLEVLIRWDISGEKWREYDFGNRVYRIENPKMLLLRKSGTTHRIIDENNLVHCLPAPGFHGCVLRWCSKDSKKPVAF